MKTYTFGCKVNRADTLRMEGRLAADGCEILRGGELPDVVVVNTCTVTEEADRQARQFLRRVHRIYPRARIIVTGCYAQSDPEGLARIEGVTSILPLAEQDSLAGRLGLATAAGTTGDAVRTPSAQTRAILKMQDGCNAYCSFCILPYLRGRSRSLSLPELEAEARRLAEVGHREIVLTGTHVGAYGRDLQPRLRFSEAVQSIARAIPGVALRISSLEPMALTPDVIRLVGSLGQIRPHFHVPLQSGADEVLRRMNRKYSARTYAERVKALAKTRPSMAIGADVIVGYPGESEKEFAETADFVGRVPITYLHVFPFSARPGTRAAGMADDVSPAVKKDRVRVMRELGARKRREFQSRFVGTVQPVIVERKRDAEGRWTGYTPHYVPVRFAGPERLVGREIGVRIHTLAGDSALGEVA